MRQPATSQRNEDRSTTTSTCSVPLGSGEKQQRTIHTPLTLRSSNLPATSRETITNELSFMQSCHNSIHSIVLVGSTVYGTRTNSSDIDIVIITTIGGHEKVCDMLFAKEIDDSLNSGENSNLEYTVLSSRQTEKLFQISSPFSYSIRYGAIIQDDGFLLLLRKKRFPLLPGKKYYRTCLYENIAGPYYGMLKKLRSEARKKGCSVSCRRKNKGCEGLQAAPMFAKLIMRMLYVTLPARGMIPLTKADVVIYTGKAYGSSGAKAAKQIISLMRGNRSSFCFDEFMVLKKFAGQLFREIVRIIGFSPDVRDIIVDAAKLARGSHHLIQNPAMKNCVL